MMIVGGMLFLAGLITAFLAFAVGSTHPTPSQTNLDSWFIGGGCLAIVGALIFVVELVRTLL